MSWLKRFKIVYADWIPALYFSIDLLYETVHSPQSCIKFDTLELELVRLLWRLERVFDRVQNGYQDTRANSKREKCAKPRAMASVCEFVVFRRKTGKFPFEEQSDGSSSGTNLVEN